MAFWLKTGLAVALLAALAFSILQLLPTDTDEGIPSQVKQEPNESKIKNNTILDDVLEGNEPSSSPDNGARGLLTPKGFCIKGRVRDNNAKENILVFDLSIERQEDSKWIAIIHETVRSDLGEFSCPLSDSGEYRVTVRTSHHKKQVIGDVFLSEQLRTKELVFSLESGFSLRGIVKDDTTGVPIKNAKVFPVFKKNDDFFLTFMLGFEEQRVSATTNATGEFCITGLDNENTVYLVAAHPLYAGAEAEADPKSGRNLELRLKKGPVVFGKAYDDKGAPISKLLISVMGYQLPMPRFVLTGKDGEFRTAPTQPGMVFVRASPLPEDKNSGFTPETQVVMMGDKDEEVIFGPGPGKVIWRGFFYDGSGAPVSNGKVHLRPKKVHKKEVRFFKAGSKALCDEQGQFEFNKLLPGLLGISPSFFRSWRIPHYSYPLKVAL